MFSISLAEKATKEEERYVPLVQPVHGGRVKLIFKEEEAIMTVQKDKFDWGTL